MITQSHARFRAYFSKIRRAKIRSAAKNKPKCGRHSRALECRLHAAAVRHRPSELNQLWITPWKNLTAGIYGLALENHCCLTSGISIYHQLCATVIGWVMVIVGWLSQVKPIWLIECESDSLNVQETVGQRSPAYCIIARLKMLLVNWNKRLFISFVFVLLCE